MTRSREMSLYRPISNTSFWNPLAGVTEMGNRTTWLCTTDSAIVRYLAENRFGTRSDLINAISTLSEKSNMNRTLGRLKTYGLIEGMSGDSNCHLGYRLTKKGLAFAEANLSVPQELLRSRPSFRSQYDHDRVVAEARRILCNSSAIGDFKTEVELRSALGRETFRPSSEQEREWKVPDGLFTLVTKKGPMRVALEVELSQKSKARYQKIMKSVLVSRQFEIVFFLCRDSKLADLISKEVSTSRRTNSTVQASSRSNGIYFCTLDMLRKNGNDALWCGEKSRFSITEVERSLVV